MSIGRCDVCASRFFLASSTAFLCLVNISSKCSFSSDNKKTYTTFYLTSLCHQVLLRPAPLTWFTAICHIKSHPAFPNLCVSQILCPIVYTQTIIHSQEFIWICVILIIISLLLIFIAYLYCNCVLMCVFVTSNY